jgi:putative peptide zinc metalloprotease protein
MRHDERRVGLRSAAPFSAHPMTSLLPTDTAAPRDLGESPEQPLLASGVQLVGEMPDTAFVDRQWLIQRNGQFIQLSELLYRVVEQMDGRRTPDEIAEGVTDATRWLVTGDQVEQLIASKLAPLGVVAGVGADDRAQPKSAPPSGLSPLAVGMRAKVVGPRVIEPVTRILQYFFAPPVLVAVLVAAAAMHYWLYRERGFLAAFVDALYTPGVLLILLGVVLVSAVFHELGHASGLRYGGGHARAMGAGFYAVFPVFFTDATDSYRLGRWARVRTGLGGVYFHLIFAMGVMGVALATGQEYLLLAVLLIDLEIIHQFIPFMRLDGYWVLADLTGIPDFFSQTGPFLRSFLPAGTVPGTRLPALRWWAKAVFLAYLGLTLPVLAFLLYLLITRLPRIVTVFWDALMTHVEIVQAAAGDGDLLTVATSLAQIVILTLPLLGIGYLLFTLTWRPLKAAWRQPTIERRLIGVILMAGLIAELGVYWAPRLPFASRTPPAGVKTYDVASNRHVKGPVSYPQSPPVGGPHDPLWQNCGFYDQPLRNENAVHSLEHGAVWITYRPGLPEDQVRSLQGLARRESRVLISPYPNLPSPVVLSAWGRQLKIDSVRDARLDRFLRAYIDNRHIPEPGGPCTKGKATAR